MLLFACLLVACGGGGGGGGAAPPPPPPPPVVVPGLETPDLAATPGVAAGSVVLRFTAPSPRATAYLVRSRVRHIETDADFAAATPLAHGTTPGEPGTPETITFFGLEEGRTLQLAVQVVRGTVASSFGFAVACRAPGTGPAAPGSAIPLTAPGTLAQDGATYLLQNDVTAAGTAFRITGRNVTLDLGGRTVTYGTGGGTCHGVSSEFLYGSGTTVVRNGTIVQGGGTGTSCHGVHFRGGHVIRVSRLSVTVRGTDAGGIVVGDSPTGDVRVDRCTVRCETQVVTNRSYPGVAAIALETVTRGVEVDQNLVLSSPQWGIKVQGTSTTGDALVHHNRVVGTKALVANAYMIGIYKPDVDVFENELAGESRGVHMDAVDGSGTGCRLHDNAIRVQDQRNPEYPDYHWVHGVKVEGASGARIERNAVAGVADDAHAEVRAVDLDLEGASGVVVARNRVSAVATTPTWRAHALEWSSGTASAPNDVVVRQNVFVATDRLVDRAWAARQGGVLAQNAFVRDLTLGAGHAFAFEFFDSSDALPSPGHRVVDAITDADPVDVAQWPSPAPFQSTREWTVTVVAAAGGAPTAGAVVVVRDRDGVPVLTATTDASGTASGTVVGAIVSNGPTVLDRNPFSVSVTKPGVGSATGAATIRSPVALTADLGAGALAVDATPPAAPASLAALRMSASRAYLRWDPATDPSGVAGYLVLLGGALAGVTDENRFLLSALPADAPATVSVVALDRGGNRSAPSPAVVVTTGPEDRGP